MRNSRPSWSQQERLIEHTSWWVQRPAQRLCVGIILLSSLSSAHPSGHGRLHFVLGEIEVDESYFGGRRKGQGGRGAAGEVPVFGLLKHGSKVYVKMISDIKGSTLLLMCRPSGTIGSNCLRIGKITSTASRISGTRPRDICTSFNGIPKEHFPSL